MPTPYSSSHLQFLCYTLAPMNFRASQPAAFFDLDKTIIARSCSFAFGREFLHNGLITPVTALQLSLAQTLYRIAGHSSEQMDATRDQLLSMVTGWEVQTVRRITNETLQQVVSPTIYAEAKELIAHHQRLGHDVVIVSASPRDLVEPIARELGVYQVAASELAVQDGRYTGDVLFYCKGENKAQAIREFAEVYGYDLERSFAYSDSATDLPMLEIVGTAVAVNPDRGLRRIAVEQGWDIKVFKNPVPLLSPRHRSRVAVPALVLLACGVGAWAFYRSPRNAFGFFRTSNPTT